MKILLLADANSSHTIKWARSLSENGIQLCIFSINNYNSEVYKSNKNITVVTSIVNNKTIKRSNGALNKIKYLKVLPDLKKTIRKFKPDILHAHYASSYGLLGALANFHPFILSVWGSDVFCFPLKSIIHKKIFEFNLKKADKILSTSHVMAKETNKYTDKKIEVTPFGIDLKSFIPKKVDNIFSKNSIVIGTIKSLEKIYGIQYLIDAFKIIKKKYPDKPLKLLIVGDGSQKKHLQGLVENYNLANDTIFTGKIPYDQVVHYHNALSIYVALSESESFGVSIIEASACEKPVVVSNVGGLPEVVENNITGIVVPAQSSKKAAEAIEKLINNSKLSCNMGKEGRKRVKKLYNWVNNVNQMINIYTEILK